MTINGHKLHLCVFKERYSEWMTDIIYSKNMHVIFAVGPYDVPKNLKQAEDKINDLMNKYKIAVTEYKKNAIKIKKKELLEDFKQK